MGQPDGLPFVVCGDIVLVFGYGHGPPGDPLAEWPGGACVRGAGPGGGRCGIFGGGGWS
jgi:hypothetical protein